jgi:hypothetical protein
MPSVENKKIWGLPYLGPSEPIALGILSGLSIGSLYNLRYKRPPLTSNL